MRLEGIGETWVDFGQLCLIILTTRSRVPNHTLIRMIQLITIDDLDLKGRLRALWSYRFFLILSYDNVY